MLRRFALPGQLLALALLFTLTGQTWFLVSVHQGIFPSRNSFEIQGSDIIAHPVFLLFFSITLLGRLSKGYIAKVVFFLIAACAPLLFLFSQQVFYAKLSGVSGLSGDKSLGDILATATIYPQPSLFLSLVAYLVYLACLLLSAFFTRYAPKTIVRGSTQLKSTYIWDSLNSGVDPTQEVSNCR